MPEASLDKDTVRIGFIGLGLMGTRLVRRLNAAGWKLEVWDLDPEHAKSVSQGSSISVAPSLAALAGNSDVVMSSVPNDAAVHSVYFSSAGVLSAAKPETIILEMSTISADLSVQLHHKAALLGIRVLDLAVSGSTPAVENGTITLLAGGDRKTFDACMPIFASLAGQWFLIGPAGSGVRMKLVVNLLLGIGMEALAEAISLGEHLRIDRKMLLDVLSKTAVVPAALRGKFNKIERRDYSPEFPVRLMLKDLNLILAAASTSGLDLPAMIATQKVFASCPRDDEDLDLSVITQVREKANPSVAS